MFFDEVKGKKPKARRDLNKDVKFYDQFKAREIELISDEELISYSHMNTFVFDTECYPNYWLFAAKCVETGKFIKFELSPDSIIDLQKFRWFWLRFCFVGFNNIKYDNVIVNFVLNNYGPEILQQISNELILTGTRPEELYKTYGIIPVKANTYDLIEVCPLSGSLKLYGARLHCKRLQELPFSVGKILTKEESTVVSKYCVNDLYTTDLIRQELKEQLELRIKMSYKYNLDLRSKSDAQIAEAVIASEIKAKTRYYPKRPKVDYDAEIYYRVPDCINFSHPVLLDALDIIRTTPIKIDINGSPILPDTIKKKNIQIGLSSYQMGLGGLHSKEESIAHVANDEYLIIDVDVESFYPKIILNQGIFPKHLGKVFLEIFENIVNTRVNAKRNKDNVTSDSLKIVINGTFGKLGSQWSIFYSPDLLVQTTISGQLYLLMLIDRLEQAGISVISANTDGIVSKVKKSDVEKFQAIIKKWEFDTSFKMEETRYKGLYSRDVNNYIAIKEDNSGKTKGFVANPWNDKKTAIFRFHKNPEGTICSTALSEFISKRIPIEETIRNCTDITKFVFVRNVKGGGEKDGMYLGKVVRWYYSTKTVGTIDYIKSGNKVAKSDTSMPLMELPDTLPTDIDYDAYINVVQDMLSDVGYYPKPTLLGMLNGQSNSF